MSGENAPVVPGTTTPPADNLPTQQNTTPPAGEQRQEGETQTTENQTPKSFTQEDVDKIVSKRLSKAERAWERRHQQLLETTLARIAPAQQQQQPATSGSEAPNPDSFESYTDYLRELTRYEAEQAVKRTGQQSAEQQQRTATQQRAQQVQQTLQQRMAAASEKYDDFEDVVMTDDLTITPHMAEVIAESEVGGEVAYFLGKNKAEAARIAAMSPLAAARALGLIEAKLTAASATPAVSNAPPPPTPVGNRAVVSKDPDNMSVEEWTEWRNKQLKSRNS